MMKCDAGCPQLLNLTLLLNRLAFGVMLLNAGWMKVHTMGVQAFYEQAFLKLKPVWLPEWFAWPYGHAIPFIEILLGLGLIVGFLTRLTGLATSLLIVSITIALLGAEKVEYGTIFSNLVFITLSLLLVATGAGAWSVDACLAKWCCRRKDDAAAAAK